MTRTSNYAGSQLPNELLLLIAAFSSRQTIGRLCCVSRRFCSVFIYPLYKNILDLDEKQSLLLGSTLRKANQSSWRPHPAELIRTLMLTDGKGKVKWSSVDGIRTVENLFCCVPGGGGSPLRTLHWSVCTFIDELGRLLLTPGNFPHLKELFVKSDGSNRNFLFMHKGGLDTFSLELAVDLDDKYESLLISKLGESMHMLPTTSPALRSLSLRLDLGWQWEDSQDFAAAINDLRFPFLEKLDLHVRDVRDGRNSMMNFIPFLEALPQLVDLSVWVIGTEFKLERRLGFSYNLRSFKGDSIDCASLLRFKPKNLNSLVLRLLPYRYPYYKWPLPTHTTQGLTRLTVTAQREDGSVLKHAHEMSPKLLASIISSFPNLQHLDICISDTMSDYFTDLIQLTKLETLRVHEYRREKIPPNQLPAAAFAGTCNRYARRILQHLGPALSRLASVEVHFLVDDRAPHRGTTRLGPECRCRECEEDRKSGFMLERAEIEITYHFGVARSTANGEASSVVLEWSDVRDWRD
ncbi:hypothetical protein HMN09_01018900 [Mycena chlorophos]|uniref:F-box domain-containing protein n=1 Tax=Mycena chlorophos TaxID=658473 RepID=A0A8H6SEC5_MYCCL|nr:hypothetical protein HMN09_01018900 [Mycena chlorophos]